MRIGYSCWGFLGAGITDTPDGGRSHRRPLIDALAARGHELVLLQKDRDREENGDDLGGAYAFDAGTPDLDVLFLEWRWPITGRNTTPCGTTGHTCDLHRQHELLHHYVEGRRAPAVIWDKDRQLSLSDGWRHTRGVTVCEAALAPTPGAHRLLFPAADAWLDAADPERLAALPRESVLGYVGNQYDRDEEFDYWFAPAAACFPHRVGGKWPGAARWPHVTFLGRLPFTEVTPFYEETLATVLLLPARYAEAGQMTQRLFESVLAGCLPLAPDSIRQARRFVPLALIVHDGSEVISKLRQLREFAGSWQHIELISACLGRLELFRLSRQVDTLETLLAEAVKGPRG